MFYILSKDLQFLEFSAVNPQRSTDCRPVTKRHGNSCVTKLSIASLFSEKKLKHLGYCHDMFRFQSRKSWSVGQQRKKKACIVVFTGTDTVCLLQFLCHFSTQVETEVGRWNPLEKPKEVEPLITSCTLRKSYLSLDQCKT